MSEALFNFVNAWGLMFLPMMASDPVTRRNVPRWPVWWVAVMALTNVFFIPYLALRAVPLPHPSGLSAAERTQASLSASPLPAVTERGHAYSREGSGCVDANEDGWQVASRIVGSTALFFGGLSFAWALAARPEFGGLGARVDYAIERFNGERVFFAFVLDTGLYAVWQALLLGAVGAPAPFRYLPFFGLAFWLLSGRPRK